MALDKLTTIQTSGIVATGIVTSNSFAGDGSGLTGVVGSGSGVVVQDDTSVVGTAGTIDFGTALDVSAISAGIVTVGGTDENQIFNIASHDGIDGGLKLGGTLVTASASEINTLKGITADVTELNILDGVTATTSELNIMDGVTATTSELNIMDGDTSASSTTIVDADRVVVNDAGTMKQVAVTDLAAYFDDEITLNEIENIYVCVLDHP